MMYVTLSNGVKMPQLGYGVYQVTKDECERCVLDALKTGYPIWWGIAAWPINGFVEGNDFSGKTVIPFCTSASSGLGDSAKLLEESAGSGKWLEGRRFSSGASEGDVAEWLGELSAAA